MRTIRSAPKFGLEFETTGYCDLNGSILTDKDTPSGDQIRTAVYRVNPDKTHTLVWYVVLRENQSTQLTLGGGHYIIAQLKHPLVDKSIGPAELFGEEQEFKVGRYQWFVLLLDRHGKISVL